MKLKLSSLLIAGSLTSAIIFPAQANDTTLDLLKVLYDQGTITKQNYELLINAANKEKEAVSLENVQAQNAPKITTDGKLKIESADGNWAFQPIGRVMWDAISIDNDADGSDEFSGTQLRRARLGFTGSFYNWGYKFESDFAKSDVSIKDAYLSYNTKFSGNKTSIKLGQSQIAFGFNIASSSNNMALMDRPWFADKVTSPARQSGVVVKVDGKNWTASSSVTQGSFSGGTTEERDNGTTLALRGTYIPYAAEENELVQIGLGYMRTGSHNDESQFSNGLSANKGGKISSSTIAAGDFGGSDALGLDAVTIFGPFHTLTEYNSYTAENTSASDTDINSLSIEAGYFFTGESMKLKGGKWSGITPSSSKGAWQVAARFETTDIDDNVKNEEADMWTVGVNYYANKNVRVMLNYSKVTSYEVAGIEQPKPSAFKLRAQVKW